MNTENDKHGGSAFPLLARMGDDAVTHGGLTVRDWLAANASEDDIESCRHVWSADHERIVERRSREEARYAFADRMLAVRAKETK